jgi:ADP-ribose pyrophosphatase
MLSWKTIGKKPLCRPNQFLAVELHQVELPDGRRIDDWSWVIMPDYATILARDRQGKFIVFRQRKYAVEGISLAVPGGFLEDGEDPLMGAQRELQEETGFAADQWLSLGNYVVDPNRFAGRGHLFLALGIHPNGVATGGDLEEQETLWLSQDELEQALDSGQFKAMAWAMTVTLGLRQLAK